MKITIRTVMRLFLAIGGFYFILESTRIPEDKLITIPLYIFYLILGGWFCSLGMEVWLCDERVKNIQNGYVIKEEKEEK